MDNNENIIFDSNEGENEVNAPKSNEIHHSHHHHSHHHGHSKGRHRSFKSKAKSFVKRNRYKIANAGIALLFVVILGVLGSMLDKYGFVKNSDNSPVNNPSETQKTSSSIYIEIPMFEEDVVLVNSVVNEFMKLDYSADNYKMFEKSQAGRLDLGLCVSVWYNIKGIPEGCSVKKATLNVSEKNDFSLPAIYNLDNAQTSVDIYNLKTDTKYFYRFDLEISNGTQSSVSGSFKTAKTPRLLNVEGVANLRDFGGWETVDGYKVRQGILYRSAEIDGAVDSKYTITANGVNTLLTEFGIRTEMDLRSSSENVSGADKLGAGVEHIYYGSQMYTDVFTGYGQTAMRNVFSDLAAKSDAPILLHCTHGVDRTGTVCFILGALLGMSEEDLMRDYQLSALYHGGLWSAEQMNSFVERLKTYEGNTLQEKAENYLLSIGVTQQEIKTIKEIYLER